jgi:hypothetical protein
VISLLLAIFVTRAYLGGTTNSKADGAPLSPTGWIEPSVDDLAKVCGPNRADQSLEACKQMCEPAGNCCKVPRGVEGSCLDEHPQGCELYKMQCSVLEVASTNSGSSGAATSGGSPQRAPRPGQGKRPAKRPGQNQHSSPSSSTLPDDDHLTDDVASLYKKVPVAPQDILDVCSAERLDSGLEGLRGCAGYCVKVRDLFRGALFSAIVCPAC